jgi:hypothetical protein
MRPQAPDSGRRVVKMSAHARGYAHSATDFPCGLSGANLANRLSVADVVGITARVEIPGWLGPSATAALLQQTTIFFRAPILHRKSPNGDNRSLRLRTSHSRNPTWCSSGNHCSRTQRRPTPQTSLQRTIGCATPTSAADRPCSTRATWRTTRRDSSCRRMKTHWQVSTLQLHQTPKLGVFGTGCSQTGCSPARIVLESG